MSDSFSKSVSFRLAHVAKLHRARAAILLSSIGLYPGQETILKALVATDGRTMGELAAALSVRPPTVTKMVARLGAQGLVERRAEMGGDARLARVYLSDLGRERAAEIDAVWRRLEKQALGGLDAKDRKRLRKLLRVVGRNLAAHGATPDDVEPENDAPEAMAATEVSA
jgi:DNA-binding MarR family transcriptional regulator